MNEHTKELCNSIREIKRMLMCLEVSNQLKQKEHDNDVSRTEDVVEEKKKKYKIIVDCLQGCIKQNKAVIMRCNALDELLSEIKKECKVLRKK